MDSWNNTLSTLTYSERLVGTMRRTICHSFFVHLFICLLVIAIGPSSSDPQSNQSVSEGSSSVTTSFKESPGNIDPFLSTYPTPHTRFNRIMGFILAFNYDHIDPLLLIFNEYTSMCEGGWDPTVLLFTTVHWSNKMDRFLRSKTYCYRLGRSIHVKYSVHDPSITHGLGAVHRTVLAQEVDNYDVFVYHEDDMVFKFSHLVGYLYETRRLHTLMPHDGIRNHTIGFQRYRRSLLNGDVHHAGIHESDIISSERFEESSHFRHECLASQPYIVVEGNKHQASWVFTRHQVKILQEKCQFLNHSSPSREFMSSFSLFDHKSQNACGLHKLLPPDRLTTFSMNHYYHSKKHPGHASVFETSDNILIGEVNTSTPHRLTIPWCWHEIITTSRLQQNITTPMPNFTTNTNDGVGNLTAAGLTSIAGISSNSTANYPPSPLLPLPIDSNDPFLSTYPTPHTRFNRIMGFILAFNYDHIDPLLLIFNEYTSMCEGGWDPTVLLFTTVNETDTMDRYLRSKTYCYRLGRSIHVKYSVHDPSINIGLSVVHRTVLAQEVDNYDVFVYHEDDMVFKFSHLVAYLNETRRLHTLIPNGGIENHVIGLQRYRRILRSQDSEAKYAEQDIFESDLLEEMPHFQPICINETEPYLMVQGNQHQAIWIFTQFQVKILQKKCSFYNHTWASREYMSSFSVYDHKPLHCGMVKLIPAARLTTFTIYHYYQQRHVSWTPVFFADENLVSGHVYSANPGAQKMTVPACWNNLVATSMAEQFAPSSPPTTIAASPSAQNSNAGKIARFLRDVYNGKSLIEKFYEFLQNLYQFL